MLERDSSRGAGSGEIGTRRFVGALVGFLLGQLAGDKAVTVARVVLWWFAEEQLTARHRVAEASLFVILVVTGASAAVGLVAIRRKWVYAEAFLLSVFVGVFTAVLVIIDYSLPVATHVSDLRVGQPLYFLGWVFGLWFLPSLVLPNPGGTLEGRVLRGFGALAVVAPMTIIGLATGFVLEARWGSSQGFWIAKPLGMNAICGSLVVVAFANIWWRGLEWSTRRSRAWPIGVTTLASAYSGLWGLYFYEPGAPVEWRYFFGFCTLPVVGVLAVYVAYALTRREARMLAVGWPVSGWFWLLLPVTFASMCGVNAVVALACIEMYEGQQLVVLAWVHSISGVVMGVSLVATVGLFSLIPDSVRGGAEQDSIGGQTS